VLTLFGFLSQYLHHRFVDMINERIKYRDTILYDKRRRSAGLMSVKRNALRKQSDTQHKIHAMMCKISDRIERKDDRRNKRLARKRTMTR